MRRQLERRRPARANSLAAQLGWLQDDPNWRRHHVHTGASFLLTTQIGPQTEGKLLLLRRRRGPTLKGRATSRTSSAAGASYGAGGGPGERHQQRPSKMFSGPTIHLIIHFARPSHSQRWSNNFHFRLASRASRRTRRRLQGGKAAAWLAGWPAALNYTRTGR